MSQPDSQCLWAPAVCTGCVGTETEKAGLGPRADAGMFVRRRVGWSLQPVVGPRESVNSDQGDSTSGLRAHHPGMRTASSRQGRRSGQRHRVSRRTGTRKPLGQGMGGAGPTRLAPCPGLGGRWELSKGLEELCARSPRGRPVPRPLALGDRQQHLIQKPSSSRRHSHGLAVCPKRRRRRAASRGEGEADKLTLTSDWQCQAAAACRLCFSRAGSPRTACGGATPPPRTARQASCHSALLCGL